MYTSGTLYQFQYSLTVPLPSVKGDKSRRGSELSRGTVLQDITDLLLSLLILFLSSPVLLAAMFAVKLTSRGPVFYSQTRVGRLGRRYKIYKLRTMVHHC